MHPDVAALDAALERSFGALGQLEPQVFSRETPHRTADGRLVPWPAEALGKQRIVRRPNGNALFVTHGLSYPFDEAMHGPGVPALGYELGVEVAGSEPMGAKTVAASSNAELANAWPVHALWFLSGAYVEDRWDLLPRFVQFPLVSGIVPPLPGLERCVTPEGYVGVLQGIPLTPGAGCGPSGQLVLGRVGSHESRLVMLTVVTPDELAYAQSVPDSSKALDIAKRLTQRGPGHVSSAVRRSVLP